MGCASEYAARTTAVPQRKTSSGDMKYAAQLEERGASPAYLTAGPQPESSQRSGPIACDSMHAACTLVSAFMHSVCLVYLPPFFFFFFGKNFAAAMGINLNIDVAARAATEVKAETVWMR